MTGATTKITIGDTDYAVPKLNLGQLEEVTTDAFELPPARRPFAILRIALRRAKPEIADIDALELSANELADAVGRILATAGLAPAKPAGTGDRDAAVPNPAAPAAAGA